MSITRWRDWVQIEPGEPLMAPTRASAMGGGPMAPTWASPSPSLSASRLRRLPVTVQVVQGPHAPQLQSTGQGFSLQGCT